MGSRSVRLMFAGACIILVASGGCFGSALPRVSRFPIPAAEDLSCEPRLFWQAEFAGGPLMWAADRRAGIVVAHCAGQKPSELVALNREGSILARVAVPGPLEVAGFRCRGGVVEMIASDGSGRMIVAAVDQHGRRHMPLLEEPYPWDEMHKLQYHCTDEQLDFGVTDGYRFSLQFDRWDGRGVIRAFVRSQQQCPIR